MAERIIPVLTGADSRLTTTIPMLDTNQPWYGFDNSSSTLFHSTINNATGDIIWLGDSSYIPESYQFTAQSGYETRIPGAMQIYGTNDSGATWTEIYSVNVSCLGQTKYSISGNTPYKGFKFHITYTYDWYLAFVDLEFLGTGGGSVSVHVDTKRQLKSATTVNVDTRRKMSGPISVNVDTSRKTKQAQTANIDTRRRIKTIAIARIDTKRRLKLLTAVMVDTSRRRSIPFGYQQRGTRNIVVTVDTERRLI